MRKQNKYLQNGSFQRKAMLALINPMKKSNPNEEMNTTAQPNSFESVKMEYYWHVSTFDWHVKELFIYYLIRGKYSKLGWGQMHPQSIRTHPYPYYSQSKVKLLRQFQNGQQSSYFHHMITKMNTILGHSNSPYLRHTTVDSHDRESWCDTAKKSGSPADWNWNNTNNTLSTLLPATTLEDN